MPFLIQAHSGPLSPKVRGGDRGTPGGEFRPGFLHSIDALREPVRQQFLVASRSHNPLERGEFLLRFLSFKLKVRVRHGFRFHTRIVIGKQCRLHNRIEDPSGYPCPHRATVGTPQTTVCAFTETHGALTSAAANKAAQKMGGFSGPGGGGMVDLCGLPGCPVDQWPVGGRIVKVTHPDFPQVHPVRHDFAGGGWANVEHPSYLPPRLAGGTGTKRSPDLGCVITEPEPPVWPFDVTTGGAAHRPDAKPYRPRFSFRDLVGVTFPLHRREGQEHVAGHSAFGGGGVNVFRDGDNLAAGGFDAFDHGECAGHAHATQPVELGDDQSFGFTGFDLTDRPVQDWSGGAAAGHVELGGQHFNLEPSGVSELADSGLLKFGGDEVFPAAYTGHAGVSEPHAVHFSVPRLRGHRELSASVNGLRSVTGVVS